MPRIILHKTNMSVGRYEIFVFSTKVGSVAAQCSLCSSHELWTKSVSNRHDVDRTCNTAYHLTFKNRRGKCSSCCRKQNSGHNGQFHDILCLTIDSVFNGQFQDSVHNSVIIVVGNGNKTPPCIPELQPFRYSSPLMTSEQKNGTTRCLTR